jgi:PucR C-terminal helix-turn-helix domain
MQRTEAFESNRQSVQGRGADPTAPRPTPLTLVSGAVAGDDLESVTEATSQAIGGAVAIAIPALGEPVVRPRGALPATQVDEIRAHALSAIGGSPGVPPDVIAEAVAVRIGEQVVGIVAAAPATEERVSGPERRAWLEAAAAAASIMALIRDSQELEAEDSRSALLLELAAGPAEDLATLLARARRMGFELGAGAAAICAQRRVSDDGERAPALSDERAALLADAGGGRILGLAPIGSEGVAAEVAGRLREHGMTVAVSTPRRGPGALHEALREAELLVELGDVHPATLAGHNETYRLLIGVLLRDPEELARLRARTISPLAEYDTRHDTDLLATLQAFLAHDGSTTETAEAMNLHRHTVGYRLSRVHEVSGLSPYESDGRERLSLGLKAHQILDAEQRRARGDGRNLTPDPD